MLILHDIEAPVDIILKEFAVCHVQSQLNFEHFNGISQHLHCSFKPPQFFKSLLVEILS